MALAGARNLQALHDRLFYQLVPFSVQMSAQEVAHRPRRPAGWYRVFVFLEKRFGYEFKLLQIRFLSFS